MPGTARVVAGIEIPPPVVSFSYRRDRTQPVPPFVPTIELVEPITVVELRRFLGRDEDPVVRSDD
jgi:hypothetical protein